jgi:hypothetical protein
MKFTDLALMIGEKKSEVTKLTAPKAQYSVAAAVRA